ncbi:hypothetical protein Poli38472_008356 [Pythium oligandrum]|uniref:Palmitoyltransferase n=1 Tax=Pythium oligandrum TaxID=41045 RepID=A0A8K1FLY1_PYTOL|nr:hypothetical protein Poli38472_008356 [Pythium oligandrum]|eukprot:TMW65714.1 hypothetical protein Poli38472_008356 [Pythium oligandrum]
MQLVESLPLPRVSPATSHADPMSAAAEDAASPVAPTSTPLFQLQAHPHPHPHHAGHAHQHGPHCSHGARPPVPIHAPPAPPRDLSPLDELFFCAKTNHLVRFQELIGLHGATLAHERDAQGHTVTHWIAQKGSSELLEFVNSIGAPMNLPSEDNVKLHPIHWACSTGNLAALKAFVRLGVDINTADATKQRTPLLIAAQNGFPLLVMYCVKQGADINLVDIDQDSAIHWAAYKGATEIVSVFQYLGLSTDAPDRYGQRPLHLAAMRGELATVQYLVEALDSDLHATDQQGRTPYELAKLKGYDRVAQYLARRQFRRKWNVFTWWESSRAPFYFTSVNFALGLLAVWHVVMPAMPELRGLYVLLLAWTLVTIVFFVQTKRTPPGELADDPQYQDEYSHVTEALVHSDASTNADAVLLERPLCHTCHIQRPLRAKHCRVCNTCVPLFDHHCPFVDNCIGEANHIVFLGFVASLVLDLILLEYILYRQWSAQGFTWWRLIGVGYALFLLLPTLHLLGFHCYLTLKNLTTNEVMNAHRYEYMRSAAGAYRNPFDRGMLRNVMDRCLPTSLISGSRPRRRYPRKADGKSSDDERQRLHKTTPEEDEGDLVAQAV